MRVRYWIHRYLRRWKIYEPAYCRNCGALSFTKEDEVGRLDSWVCDQCHHIHRATFGGEWRADSPEEAKQ